MAGRGRKYLSIFRRTLAALWEVQVVQYALPTRFKAKVKIPSSESYNLDYLWEQHESEIETTMLAQFTTHYNAGVFWETPATAADAVDMLNKSYGGVV